MRKSPALNHDDDETGDRAGGDLRDKHDSGRDLHVMAKLQVTGEVEGLLRHDGAVNLEDHHGNGLSWDHVARDEFGKDVKGQLLVGNREQDSEGEDEEQGKDDGEDISPERHLRGVHLDRNRSEDERTEENGNKPPVGNISVARHQAGVNVLLILD